MNVEKYRCDTDVNVGKYKSDTDHDVNVGYTGLIQK